MQLNGMLSDMVMTTEEVNLSDGNIAYVKGSYKIPWLLLTFFRPPHGWHLPLGYQVPTENKASPEELAE